MPKKAQYGHSMREHFQFASNYTPLNHGSFGTFPHAVRSTLQHYQALAESKPDTFIRFTYPPLLVESRRAVASLVNVPVDEIVFVPNATTGINTVLRGIKFEEGDVIVYFETVYDAVERTIEYIVETTKAEMEKVDVHWPVDDAELIKRFEETVHRINTTGKCKRRVRLAVFDTILSMPGIRAPFELLTAKCKELDVLSLIDGAHGIGHIPLDLGKLQADFFVSNLHKWLYLPRGLAALHIPFRNQPLIRSTLPTSHNFKPRHSQPVASSPFISAPSTPFVAMFDFVGTIDNTNYLCVPAALAFRASIGGETAIMDYCIELAREGGDRAADILGTECMGSGAARKCAFANVRLPLEMESMGVEAAEVAPWIARKGVEEAETFFALRAYRGAWWWRVSGQVYLDVQDIEWGAGVLKSLCERVKSGQWRMQKARL